MFGFHFPVDGHLHRTTSKYISRHPTLAQGNTKSMTGLCDAHCTPLANAFQRSGQLAAHSPKTYSFLWPNRYCLTNIFNFSFRMNIGADLMDLTERT